MNKPIEMTLIGACVLLAACGGGGGADDPVPPIPPASSVTLSIADTEISEGDSGMQRLDFAVSLSATLSAEATFDYETANATAMAGSDYESAFGTLTIPAGDTTGVVSVMVMGDVDIEPDETFSLTLSAPSNNVTLASSSVTATILNDDANSAIATLSANDASVVEADTTSVFMEFEVRLDPIQSADVTFDFATSDGTAAAPGDYLSNSGSATISAGADSAIIRIEVIGDTETEPTEDLSLTLSSASANATFVDAGALGRIVDNDAPTAAGFSLNDTGVTTCGNETDSGLPCNSSADGTDQFPGQDAEVGRDLTQNDDIDGMAGFSFVKLDASGTSLADQSSSFSTDPWDCVYDQVTGVFWEAKSNSDDLRDGRWRYGFSDDAQCLDDGSDACGISAYLTAVNNARLCGFDDWRLPTSAELLSIMHLGTTATTSIDEFYFPNTAPVTYLSSTTNLLSRTITVDFATGMVYASDGNSADAVRLIRKGQ